MSILVTGGAGYIGSHMAYELADAGEDVVVLDDLSTGFHWAVPSGIELIAGDIGNQQLVKALVENFHVDAIIHFAASTAAHETAGNPIGCLLNNTTKSRSFIAAVAEAGIKRFVFSSTAAIYGSPTALPVSETAPLKPISPFGSSKLMTEIMLAETAVAHDFRYVALRSFNVAGADPASRTGQSAKGIHPLVRVACETALGKRNAVEVFGTDYPTRDGTCIRDYVHVKDLVDAHMAALRYLEVGGKSDIFNCGCSRGVSVLELIDAVQRVSGNDVPIVKSGPRPGDAAELVADTKKIRRVLHWSPRNESIDEIVASALTWERVLNGLDPEPASSKHPLGDMGFGNDRTPLPGFPLSHWSASGWSPA